MCREYNRVIKLSIANKQGVQLLRDTLIAGNVGL